MKKLKLNLVTILLIFSIFISITFIWFFWYKTVSTTWNDAIKIMTNEELEVLRKISKMDKNTTSEDVFLVLWEPTRDIYVLATWTWMANSQLIQWRMYFYKNKPVKFRFVKLWYFFYEVYF